MAKNDRFAAIAATEIRTGGKGLIPARTRKPETRELPATAAEAPRIPPKKDPAEALRVTMDALRRKSAPFLRELAPKLNSFRRSTEFTEFQWRIADRDRGNGVYAAMHGEGGWERVSIPHYGGPVGKAETFYRREFTPAELPGKDECAWLCFDGADYEAAVYLNGRCLGIHEGFFAPFAYDCTDALTAGANCLFVSLKNDFVHVGNGVTFGGEEFTGDKIYAATGPGWDDPEVGWHHCPPGMGIYQPVRLEIRPRTFISDLWVRPVPEEGRAEVKLEVFRTDVGRGEVSFRISVLGRNHEDVVLRDGHFVPYAPAEEMNETFVQAAAVFGETPGQAGKTPLAAHKGVNRYSFSIPMGDFRTWSPDAPWLYMAQVELLNGEGERADTAEVSFGMRSFVMADDGEMHGMLYLNGEKCRLRGANTMGFEQQAVMRGDLEQLTEDILLAKACNMNFLRITQRPVQSVIYDTMDRLGLMAQTDLPLFGALRCNKLPEAVREAGEMERLIRSHPCCIMVSYINEPAPDLKGMPHLFSSTRELSVFFEMADCAVHLENPDRVTKHVDGDYDPPRTTLQDNHCYTMWYNGFGVDAGALHKGDWVPVPENWYYGCGEFGAEGLEEPEFMRRRYPPEWLPQTAQEEADWNPEKIIGCQAGGQHYLFHDSGHTLQEWADLSRDYQADAAKWMTEAFRRDRRMVSFALHLFIDAFPAGWLKSVVDCERNPKPAFFAYQNALAPVMVSLRTDRLAYFPGDTAEVELWLCNDLPRDMENLRILCEAQMPDGSVQRCGTVCGIGESTAEYAGEARFRITGAGKIIVRSALYEGERLLHENELTLVSEVRETPKTPLKVWIPEGEGRAAELAKALGAVITDRENASAALISSCEAYLAAKASVDAFTLGGGRTVFLELPAGSYDLCGVKAEIKQGFMMPRHFASRDTGHPWVKGFRAKAIRRWYDPALDRIVPVLENTFTGDMRPVVTSGNTDASGTWQRVMAVGEAPAGKGRVVLSLLALSGKTDHNPAAYNLALRLLTADAE